MSYKNIEQAKAYQKKYYENNRDKELARIKEWKILNKEKLKKQAKEYNELNKEKIAKQKKEYYLINKEKIDEKNKKYNIENQKERTIKHLEWRKNNRGKAASIIKKYQANKKQRLPLWLTDFDKLKIKCIYSVAAMLTRENKESWHVDHIIPLQGKLVSGLHVPSNLQFIFAKENISKKNKFEVV